MTINKFAERPKSRASTSEPPTETRLYVCEGEQDKSVVEIHAHLATPLVVATVSGILHRQDIRIDPMGFALYHVTVPYGKRKKENGTYTWSFSSKGGTARIFVSKEKVQSYAAAGNPPDHKGVIGVKEDGNAEGTEIISPALKLTFNFRHPLGIVTFAKAKQLARYTGYTNLNPFASFAAGELLYLGSDGSDGSEAEASVDYEFLAIENVDGLSIGDINNIAKKGHEYVWVEYKDDVDEDQPVKQPQFAHVERVYDKVDFETALGWSP